MHHFSPLAVCVILSPILWDLPGNRTGTRGLSGGTASRACGVGVAASRVGAAWPGFSGAGFSNDCVYVRPSSLCVARVLAFAVARRGRASGDARAGGDRATYRASYRARPAEGERRGESRLDLATGRLPRAERQRGVRKWPAASVRVTLNAALIYYCVLCKKTRGETTRCQRQAPIFAGGALCGRGRHLDARPQRREREGEPPPVAAAGPPFHRGLPAAAPPASRRRAVGRAAARPSPTATARSGRRPTRRWARRSRAWTSRRRGARRGARAGRPSRRRPAAADPSPSSAAPRPSRGGRPRARPPPPLPAPRPPRGRGRRRGRP
mmetsp:Transcript_15758/g.51370  ORF Transcript_15758/g.51370 Transcript_15758/m.51370 type:complete len:324 (-) Transcript_15758:667-1638(-)